jgi:hypothetical protein
MAFLEYRTIDEAFCHGRVSGNISLSGLPWAEAIASMVGFQTRHSSPMLSKGVIWLYIRALKYVFFYHPYTTFSFIKYTFSFSERIDAQPTDEM